MILKNLNINYFRNYNYLHWEPHTGINFITGSNAQGKTNLLEAVFLVVWAIHLGEKVATLLIGIVKKVHLSKQHIN